MFKQTPSKRVLFRRTPKYLGLCLFFVALVILSLITTLLTAVLPSTNPLSTTTSVQAATSSNLNYQARLLTSSGNIVPDGYYNLEFKLYNVSSGGTALWTETYYDSNGVTAGNDNRVRVVNGYLSVNLATLTAFPAMNWDQDTWLTMNVGGSTQTATPTYDGEMAPRIKLTSVPYAFQAQRAEQLSKRVGSYTADLLFPGTLGQNTIYNLQDPGTASTNICLSSGNCLGGGGGGANTALSNLSGVAINTSLLSGSATIDLGSNANPFRDLYVGGTATNNFRFTGTASAARTITIPDATGTLCLSTGNCSGSGSTNSLQAAYDAGNTVLTTDARNISVTLANTTTDANFIVNVATSSTGALKVQNNSTDVLSIGSAGQLALAVQGSTGGLLIGGDTNLYRSAADVLGTDDSLRINNSGGFGYALSVGGIGEIQVDYPSIVGGRLKLDNNGQLSLARQGSTAGIVLGGDTNLYRSSANELKTDDVFTGASTIQAVGDVLSRLGSANQIRLGDIGGLPKITFGSAEDTNLYRSAADVLETDDAFVSNGLYYGGTGSPINVELSRSIPTTVNNYVEIGNFSLSSGAHNFRVSITNSNGGFSVAKTYLLPVNYNATSNTWKIAAPDTDTGAYTGNDYALDINASNDIASLRLRRTGGATAGTAMIRIESVGSTSDVFTATSATGTATAPTAYYTSLTQFAGTGNVRVNNTNTTAFQIQNAAGTNTVFNADTTNTRIGIGTTTPSYTLDVQGGAGIVGQFSGRVIGGDAVNNNEFVTLGQVNSLGAGNYILDGTSTQTANFNIQSAATGSIAAVIQGASGGTVDLLDVRDGSANNVFRVTNIGTALFQNSTNSTTAFQIQNAAGTSNLFVADTTNTRIGIGRAAPLTALEVAGVITAAHGDSNGFGVNRGGTLNIILQQKTNDVVSLANPNNSSISFSTNGTEKAVITNAGQLQVSTQGSTGGLLLGGDTNLYRSAADTLKTDDNFIVTGTSTLTGNTTVGGTLGVTGTITGTAGLNINGTGNSYIMGPLGLGTTNPQAASALTIANGAWISGVDAAGTGFINMFSVNANNEIQVGAALNIDGGIILPTSGGQVTFADMPIDASTTAGTPESYTFRVGSSNALTVYGQADGSGGAQNIRVAVGSSIAPQYTLDVGGDINTTGVYRINGTQIASSNLSDGSNLAKLNGTGPQTFTGNNKFTGTFVAQNASNSTTAFQIQNAAGTSNLFNADTTNTRIGIGTNAPGYTLDVNGTFRAASTSNAIFGNGTTGGVQIGDGTITKTSGGVFTLNSGITASGAITGTTLNGTTGINTGAGAGTNRIDVNGNLVNIGTITSGLINGQTISSSANFTGTLTLATLGSATSPVALCRNASNQIASCGVNSAGVTLQNAYDAASGNSITTTDARDILFTLANTTTDSNFVVNVATGSTGALKVQNNGSDILNIGSAGQLALSVQGSGGGLVIGGDTNLYRTAADTLKTDDTLVVTGGNSLATTQSRNSLEVAAGSNSRLTLGEMSNGDGNPALTFYRTASGLESGRANRIVSPSSTRGLVFQGGSGTDIAYGSETYTTLLEVATDGKLLLGPEGSQDTNLYRSAANTLKTDDAFESASLTTGTISSGLVNGQTISSTANFTGTLKVNGINVAAAANGGSVVEVSGNYPTNNTSPYTTGAGSTATWGSGLAIDGSTSSTWADAGGENGVTFIRVNFNDTYVIDRVRLTARYDNSVLDGQPQTFQLDFSDGSVQTFTFPASYTGMQEYRIDPVSTSFIRYTTRTKYATGNNGLRELEAYTSYAAANGSLSQQKNAFYNSAKGSNLNQEVGIGLQPVAGSGLLQLASGVTSANGIAFGSDTNLYRSAANMLKTDDALTVSGGGQAITLNGATSNYINYGTTGVAAPTFTTRSAGTKIVLYDALTGSAADYAIGIEGSTLWNSVQTTAQQFKWYGGTTQAALLSGTGNLTLGTGSGTLTSGLINSQTISSTANFTGTVAITTLGAATSPVAICRNASNQISSCGVNSAGVTLQNAYDAASGNTITTTDARNLAVTLANTTTDANFIVNVATSSTGALKVQNNSTDVLSIGSAGQLALAVQGSTGGLLIGGDTNLYRSAANNLATDDSLILNGGNLLFNNDAVIRFKDSAGNYVQTLTYSTANNLELSNRASTGSLQINNQNDDGSIQFWTGSTNSMVGSISATGQTMFKNSANSTTAFQIQNAAGTSLLNMDTTGSGALTVSVATTVNNSLIIGAKTNSGGTTADWTKVSQATAGTIASGGTAAVEEAFSSVVYNGSLYIGTCKLASSQAEIYRFDGGTTWTRVNPAAGQMGAETAFVCIRSLTVFNGSLYAGTDTSANVYRYDGGTTWTRVNSTVGQLGATTGSIRVESLAVNNGVLYAGTGDYASNKAEVYRYDGGTTWTKITGAAGTIGSGGNTGQDMPFSMVSYQNNLYVSTDDAAGAVEVWRYDGGTTWTRVSSGAGTIASGGTSGITDARSLVVYNGSIYLGTGKSGAAEIYRYDGGTTWTKVSQATAGTIASGGTSGIDNVFSLAVYNGKLYSGTHDTTGAEVYRYDGGTTWTKVSQATAGTIAPSGTASILGVEILIPYNGNLYAGTTKASAAEIYKYTAVTDQSNELQFLAASTAAGSTQQSGLPNTGSIKFVAAQQSAANFMQAATGSFIFSNGIVTDFGAYDLAEDYPTRDDQLTPGDLVSIDPSDSGFVKRTPGAQSTNIIGVYSENPGFRLSQKDTTINGGKAIPVALAGRVPVKVSTENGPIVPGDSITVSSQPGIGMKATSASRIIGKAMEGYTGSGVGSITVFINPGQYNPDDDGQIQASGTFGDINVSGTANIGDLVVTGQTDLASLNVSGPTTLNSLAVTGDASIQGKLTVGSIEVGNIKVNGHIITGGNTPTTAVNANAGTSATCTISGTDTTGTITVTTGIGTMNAGTLCKLTFSSPYGSAPRVIVGAKGASTAGLNPYSDGATSTEFDIGSAIAGVASTTYTFEYIVAQ